MSSNQPVPVSGEDQPAQPEYENVCRRNVMEDWGQELAATRGEDQPDPRLAVVAAKLPTKMNVEWAIEILAAIDAADRAAGIRRVTRDDVRCPACELWYDTEGTRCYRTSATSWVCVELGTAAGGGA